MAVRRSQNRFLNHERYKAEGNADKSITYHDDDGNALTRYLDPKAKNPPRGTKSWRHQNPGNCYPSPYDPKKKICFAIFPDYETGKKAFAALLKTERFIDLTLNQFPRFYTGLLKA